MSAYRTVAATLAVAALLYGGAASAQATTPPVVVHRQVSVPAAYSANAYWLESASGIVLIDALMLRSDARQLVAAMKETGKPLVGIILTHPHLDHFGGIRTVREAFGNVPVIATQATADGIKPAYDRSVAEGGVQGFGEDFDHDLPEPDWIVPSGGEVELAGMHFTLQDLGPLEAGNNTVVFSREVSALFSGDATVRGAWVYVGEGRPTAFLGQLEALATAFPGVRTVYSGHYDPGPLSAVLSENTAQVQFLLDLGKEYVARGEFGADGRFTDSARREMIDRLVAQFPHLNTYDLPRRVLLYLNVVGLELDIAAAASI